MAYTDINSEDRLVQATFAAHLAEALGWDSVYAWNHETWGPDETLGRSSERDVVLVRDMRAALAKLNPQLPPAAVEEAITKLTHHDFSRSQVQHNQAFYILATTSPATTSCAASRTAQPSSWCTKTGAKSWGWPSWI